METIKDAHHIFEPKSLADYVIPLVNAAPKCAKCERMWSWQDGFYFADERPLAENIIKFSKYLSRTTGQMYVKMMNVIDKCGDASYHEIYNQVLKPLGKPFGNDALSFRGIADNGLMELDHLGKYKRKFFSLTPLGKMVLEIAKANDVAYKPLRHFMKFKDTLDEERMISIQMSPDSMLDIMPETFVKMLDELLNPSSKLHEIGSYAYWLNKLVECLKKSKPFLDEFNCPEVKTWIESNMTNVYVQRFNKLFQKILKKQSKMAA